MSRVQREYRIAITAAATIGLAVTFVIWNFAAGGGSSSSNTQFFSAADESALDSPTFSEPTDWTAAPTTPKRGPVARPARGGASAAKIDPYSVGAVTNSPGVTTDRLSLEAAYTEPAGQVTDSDDRADVASWNNSGLVSSQSARSAAARTGAPPAAGGSSPGAAPASASAKTPSALASGGEHQSLSAAQSASRQGPADSAPVEDSAPAPRASAARTDNHAAPNPAIAQTPATVPPVFDSGAPLPTIPGDVAWPAPDLTSLEFDAPDSTLAESIFPEADPGNLHLIDAAGPASFDSAPLVENPHLNPEPTSLLLLGTGLGLLARRLKRREPGAA